MTRNEIERLWKVEDVAEYLRISPKTVRNRVSLGTIPYVKPGGLLRFVPEEIREWATARKSA